MLVEKNILKSDLLYSDDKSRRYLLHLEWDKTKKKACVIMLSAGKSNGIYFDRSTNNVVTNLVESDYGSADILNLCLLEKLLGESVAKRDVLDTQIAAILNVTGAYTVIVVRVACSCTGNLGV